MPTIYLGEPCPEWDAANAWARARWGERVRTCNFRMPGLYMISLDGPPARGENRFIRLVGGEEFEEVQVLPADVPTWGSRA
jgi:hypothetical protein